MKRHLRALLVCAALAAAFGITAGASNAHAQITCSCHLVQINASAELTCNVQVCISGMPWNECKTVAPGTSDVISCPSGGGLVIVDGCGNRQQLIVGDCVYNIPGPAPCCIDACIRVDEYGCLTLNLGKGTAGHCFCPGG